MYDVNGLIVCSQFCCVTLVYGFSIRVSTGCSVCDSITLHRSVIVPSSSLGEDYRALTEVHLVKETLLTDQ